MVSMFFSLPFFIVKKAGGEILYLFQVIKKNSVGDWLRLCDGCVNSGISDDQKAERKG